MQFLGKKNKRWHGQALNVPVINADVCWDGTYEPYEFFIWRHSDPTVPLQEPAWGTQSPEVRENKKNRHWLVSKNIGTDMRPPNLTVQSMTPRIARRTTTGIQVNSRSGTCCHHLLHNSHLIRCITPWATRYNKHPIYGAQDQCRSNSVNAHVELKSFTHHFGITQV